MTDTENPVLDAYKDEQEKDIEHATAVLAHTLWLYYRALLDEGFSDIDAVFLVAEYQTLIVSKGLAQ